MVALSIHFVVVSTNIMGKLILLLSACHATTHVQFVQLVLLMIVYIVQLMQTECIIHQLVHVLVRMAILIMEHLYRLAYLAIHGALNALTQQLLLALDVLPIII
jgi:hypothetical protein